MSLGARWSGGAVRRVDHLFAVAELQPVEVGIQAATGQQFIMGALIDDLTFVHDNDLVRRLDRRQPMGDDQRCAPLGKTI